MRGEGNAIPHRRRSSGPHFRPNAHPRLLDIRPEPEGPSLPSSSRRPCMGPPNVHDLLARAGVSRFEGAIGRIVRSRILLLIGRWSNRQKRRRSARFSSASSNNNSVVECLHLLTEHSLSQSWGSSSLLQYPIRADTFSHMLLPAPESVHFSVTCLIPFAVRTLPAAADQLPPAHTPFSVHVAPLRGPSNTVRLLDRALPAVARELSARTRGPAFRRILDSSNIFRHPGCLSLSRRSTNHIISRRRSLSPPARGTFRSHLELDPAADDKPPARFRDFP